MKRKLLLCVIAMGAIGFANSQTIDLIGTGVHRTAGANLTFSNPSNIDRVVVGATYKELGNTVPSATSVQFADTDEGPLGTFKTDPDLIIKHFSYPGIGATLGYFESTFNTIDGGGINAIIEPSSSDKVHGYYAYVYRNDSSAPYISYTSPESSYHFLNGSADPYVYTIPINTASSPRNIKVKVPITELDDAVTRKAVVDITAGSVNQHVEVNLFNLGDSFFLGEYDLSNVPGDVSEVTVSVYSPNHLIGEDDGDSFFVNGIVVDVDKVNEDPGCTLTQGYWKTHSKYDGDKYDKTWAELGEDSNFYLSGKSYYKALKRSPRGNKYYVLARQFIAAKLNFLNGADPSDAKEAFDKAATLFEKYTPSQIAKLKHNRSRRAKRLKRKFVKLAKVLEEYNNGIIGPGNCDEDEVEETPCLTKNDVIVTPNPVVTHGTIKFTPTHTGRTVVYMYNSYGQFVCPLYDKNVSEGQEVNFTFRARNYRNGTYYLKIWSGCCLVVKRIVIRCY